MKKLCSSLPLVVVVALPAILAASRVPAQESNSGSQRLRRTNWVSVSPGMPSVQLSSASEITSGRETMLIKTVTEHELSELRAQIELSRRSAKNSPTFLLKCSAIRQRFLEDQKPAEHEGVWRCDGDEGFVRQFLSDRKSKLSLYLARSGEGIESTIVVEPGRLARQALSTPK